MRRDLLEHLVLALRLQLQPVTVVPYDQKTKRDLPCTHTQMGEWRGGGGIENEGFLQVVHPLTVKFQPSG